MNEPILNLVLYADMYDKPNDIMNFLRMAGMQRITRKEDYLITILCSETKDNIKEITGHFPWVSTDVVNVGGMIRTEAYNQRIMKTMAPWIMFMDAGDFFPDVYSLKIILDLLPTEEYDVLWLARYDEIPTRGGETWTNVVDDVDRKVWGKLFRTKYLLENGIFFDNKVRHDDGTVFLMTAMSRTVYERFVKISTRFIPYAHIDTEAGRKLSATEMIREKHDVNMAVVRNVGQKARNDSYMQAVMRAICDGYYFANTEPVDKAVKEQIEQDIAKICRENRDVIAEVKPQDLEVFLEEAHAKILNLCNSAYVQQGYEMYFDMDDVLFNVWFHARSEDGKVPAVKEKPDRVAVFCGTRNVYDSMETAAKSLMYHTKMDRVYFLIEDDAFPRELPGVIRCINVSGQKWFDPKGKNYRNAWTWMCMIRAAFAKLLPDEKQVLSLDVDVVVNDDISELWDVDLKDYYFAGVPECDKTEKLKTVYCNFGVIMMNLEKIREDGIDEKIIESLNRDKWGCPEQDAFNHFCAGEIYPLASKYNATRAGHITEKTDEEKISHYAGIKYWKQFKPFKKFAGMSWEEVLKEVHK